MRFSLLVPLILGSSILVACGGGKHPAERTRAAVAKINAPATDKAPQATPPKDGVALEKQIQQVKTDLYLSGYRGFEGWNIPAVIGDGIGYDAGALTTIKGHLMKLGTLGEELADAAAQSWDLDMAKRAKLLRKRVFKHLERVQKMEEANQAK